MIPKITRYLFLALIMACQTTLLAFSQSTNASVEGKVVDSSGVPLQSATVVLYSLPDSLVVDGTVANADGNYSFRNISPSRYWVRVSFVGYTTFDTPAFELQSRQTLTVDDITLLEDAVTLAGVAVEAERDLIEVQPDKTVLNVQGTIASTGSTALELLRKAPGVVVDNNDNIILAGKNGVKVYIDGKPSPLSIEDLAIQLKSMQSSEIDAIEIITNPGAKYEAEGNAGIINIKLRRDQNLGMNGTVDLGYSYGERSHYSGTTTLNYRNRRLNSYGSYSLNAGKNENWMDIYRIQNNFEYDQQGSTNSGGPTNSLRFGTDFFLDQKTVVGFLVSGAVSDRTWLSTTETPIVDLSNDQLQSTLRALSDNDRNRKNGSANVNVRRDDGDGTTLNIDADVAAFQNGNRSYQPNFYFVPSSPDPDTQNIHTSNAPTDIAIYAGKIDYERPVGGGKLGVGSKISEVITDNRYRFYNVLDDAEELDIDRSNDFEYRESISAAYVTYSRKLSVFEVSGGLRAEHTRSKGDLNAFKPQNNDSVKRSYLDLFPSGGATYQASQFHQLRINYSRRVDRPSYQALNPFEFKLNELTFQRGNPFLQPQYTNNISFTHTYKYVLNSTVTYSYTNDFFAQITDSTESTRTYLETRNLGSQRTISASMSYPRDLKPWWGTYTSVTGYNTRNQGELEGGRMVDIQATVGTVYHQSSFRLPQQWKLELSGWYNSPSIWGAVYRMDSNYSIDAGVSRPLMNGRANLKVAFTDLFHTAPWRGVQDFSGLYMDVSGGWESRQVRVNMSFNLGNNQVKKARQRKTSTTDEESRVN